MTVPQQQAPATGQQPTPSPAPATSAPSRTTQSQQSPASSPQQGTTQAPPSTSIGAGAGPAQPPAPVAPPPGAGTQPSTTTQQGVSQNPGQQSAPVSGQNGGQQGGTETGQSQQPENEGGAFVFKAEVQEVILHATVLDDKQRLVTDLDRGAFTVYENGQAQTIKSFRHEDIPVAMGIVIDNSGSMREKRDKVNKAAVNLVRASNPADQVFVVNFNDEYYLDQDFTGKIDKLKEALEKVESRGGTALYDALVASADHLKKNARLEKKVIFVVTDGEDNASRESLEQAVQRLQAENGPTVYAIGLLGEEKQRRARRALQEIANRTGGVAFLPRTLDEVDEISRSVAHDIRNQYTIGYQPTTPKSAGGYRAIHVDARAKGYGKLAVRTRSGYYPGQEKGTQ
ncbi:MAG: VWA domain-containing protein [Acidobacteria bacterium]|nr:MAG: VWA domain-containing protein [Acidobacteriota bacterium]